MKKTLLLLMLWPLVAYSQSTLVTWNNQSQPTGLTNFTAQAITSGGGVEISVQSWAGGFQIKNLHNGNTSTSINTSKYVEFLAAPNAGYKITPSQFELICRSGDSEARKMEVRVSADGTNWSSLTNAASQTVFNITGGAQTYTLNFPQNYTVLPAQTLTIRVYYYDFSNNYYTDTRILNTAGNASTPGPLLKGTVAPAGGVIATNDSATMLQNGSVNVAVLNNDIATNTTFQSVTIDTPSANGTATPQADKTITFTPAAGFTGTTTFKYKVTGADNSSSIATVTVTVTPFIAPTAVADAATTNENAPVTVAVLGNDSMGTSSTVSTLTTSAPAHGTTSVTADHKIIYTPATGYSGTDTFNYTITDGNNKQATAAVTVTIIGFVPPTANNDTATTGQNIPVTVNVLANDTAGEGTITGVTITGQPGSGTATLNGNKIVYAPGASFTGTATITYKVTDSNNKSATGTLTVTVVAVAPAAAVNDTASTAKNTPITLNVTSNDNPGNSAITTVAIASNPSQGTATVNSGNTITYTPGNNYTGTDSFTYRITNGYNSSATATVNITVLQQSTNGALCGTYYIGNGGDFTTITAAVAHLNQYGVACPVTFLLKEATYNNLTNGNGNGNGNGNTTESFPITINTVAGSSLVNTVTFKPAPNKSVRIEAFRDATVGEWTGVPAVFKLNGADNIIFDGSNTEGGTTRNMFIVNSSFAGPTGGSNDYTDRAVIWIASESGSNGSNNVTVKYLQIKQTYKNTADNFSVGIYSGNNGISGDNEINTGEAHTANSNITIKGNDFINVKQGVYINGNAAAPSQNIIIHQNDLGAENNTETIIQPASLKNVNGFEFTENLIYKLYRNTAAASLVSSGIYVSGNSSNGYILNNEIKDLTKTLDEGIYFAGIVLESTNTNANITVANNFILNVISANSSNYKGNGHGIIVANGGGYKIYHNTVALNTNQSGTGIGYSAALYVENGTALDVRNNIFVNNQTTTNTRRTGIAVKAHYSSANTIFSNLDYNAIFSNDAVAFIANSWSVNDIESFGSPDYLTSLSAWRSLTGKDAHSVNVNPVFASATDLHLTTGNNAIDNEGKFIASVTKDIDGQIRSTATPTIGADEYGEVAAPEPGSDEGVYCTNSTTWNGTAWSNGEPSFEKDAIFTGNFSQIGGTFYACSIFVEGTAQVNFMNNSNAVVVHNVNVKPAASLTFESNSNLIQVENTQNIGNVTVKRNSSKLKRLDYTLWSSPVVGQILKTFSPLTDENRFYYYNSVLDNYTSVGANLIATTPFTAGKGYLIRMPNSLPGVTGYNAGNTSVVYNGVFKGVPNNGNVRIPLTYGYFNNSQGVPVLRQFNAVGNPYPSPISVTDFIDANIDNIEGTLYLWRKTNDPTKTSYSTVTKVGYAANNAPGGGGNSGNNGNDLIGNPFSVNSKGVLNTGQGFIVKALSSQDIVFRNNMRMSNNVGMFFRSANEEQTAQESETNRIWLNVINNTDAFSQTLIAYTPEGTAGYDNGLDGYALLDGGITLYTVADTHKLTIQARPQFTISDVVKLGFKTSVAGEFKVAIDSLDGIFTGEQLIYLKDNTAGSLHNLKDGPYTFTSETGTFENRFEVVYTNAALGTEIPVTPATDVIVYSNDRKIKIKSPQPIQSVMVYDLLGKLIYEKNNIDAQEFSTHDINTAQQVLMVSITLGDDHAVTKKIMMN